MHFDRKRFFDNYALKFGAPSALQKSGLNNLLWGYETYDGWWDMIEQIANSFSQVRHETAESYNAVVEGYYLGNAHAPNYFTGNTDRVRNFQKHLRYYPYFGIGYIQLTWEENYVEQDKLIRKYFPELVADFERRTGKKFDLAHVPSQALDAKISFAIMTIGMHKGTFREGHTLDRYINSKIVDHFNARNIVNGDRFYKIKGTNTRIGDKIANDAKKFEQVLRASLIDNANMKDDDLHKIALGLSVSDANNAQDADVTTVQENPLDSQESLPAPAFEPNDATDAPPDVPQVDQPAGEQHIDQQINVGGDAAEKQKMKAAEEAPPVSVPAEQKIGFWGKFSGIVTGIFTGAYTLPKLEPDSIDLIKAFLPYLVIAAIGALCFWYLTKKWDLLKRHALFITTNADMSKRDVVYTAPVSEPGVLASLKSAPLFDFALAFIVSFSCIALVALLH